MLYRLSYGLLRGDHMGRYAGEVNKQGPLLQGFRLQRRLRPSEKYGIAIPVPFQ